MTFKAKIFYLASLLHSGGLKAWPLDINNAALQMRRSVCPQWNVASFVPSIHRAACSGCKILIFLLPQFCIVCVYKLEVTFSGVPMHHIIYDFTASWLKLKLENWALFMISLLPESLPEWLGAEARGVHVDVHNSSISLLCWPLSSRTLTKRKHRLVFVPKIKCYSCEQN